MKKRIRVSEVCAKCHSVGVPVIGLSKIIELDPKHKLPGICLLIAIVVGMVLVYLWLRIGKRIIPLGDKYLEWLGIAIYVSSVSLLVWMFPLRMLICKKCKQVRKSGFGKAIPLQWQKFMEPNLACSKCGYSLVGVVENARCPECAHPFPKEWLKLTAQATPEIEAECQVVMP